LGRYLALETNQTGLIQVNRTGSVEGIYRRGPVFYLIFSFPFSLFFPPRERSFHFSLLSSLIFFPVLISQPSPARLWRPPWLPASGAVVADQRRRHPRVGF